MSLRCSSLLYAQYSARLVRASAVLRSPLASSVLIPNTMRRPADEGRDILRNLKPAMKPGHSRLLINEIIIPQKDAQTYQTSLDLMMMSLFSSRERSEDDWTEFLKSAGFRVVKFWHSWAAFEGVIEAELDA